jgi:hypothetical protein
MNRGGIEMVMIESKLKVKDYNYAKIEVRK